MWKRGISLLGPVDTAVRRTKKLDYDELTHTMHNTMTEIARTVRNGDLKTAEEYSEVLVVIIREMRSRG
jgi:hypothetical protein